MLFKDKNMFHVTNYFEVNNFYNEYMCWTLEYSKYQNIQTDVKISAVNSLQKFQNSPSVFLYHNLPS